MSWGRKVHPQNRESQGYTLVGRAQLVLRVSAQAGRTRELGTVVSLGSRMSVPESTVLRAMGTADIHRWEDDVIDG